ncbi:hypothetical protein D3C78_1517340 [compost metagenome]
MDGGTGDGAGDDLSLDSDMPDESAPQGEFDSEDQPNTDGLDDPMGAAEKDEAEPDEDELNKQ